MVAEVSKESELAQRAFRERRLCKYTRDHLDRNCLARDLVRSRAGDIGSRNKQTNKERGKRKKKGGVIMASGNK